MRPTAYIETTIPSFYFEVRDDPSSRHLREMTRRFWDAAFPGNVETLAGWVRRLTGKPVIAVGSVLLDVDFKAPEGKLRASLVPDSLLRAAEGIEDGEFDLIALGRSLLANPDLVRRVLSGDLAGLRNYDRSHLDSLI